jgi:hypothetical protein
VLVEWLRALAGRIYGFGDGPVEHDDVIDHHDHPTATARHDRLRR